MILYAFFSTDWAPTVWLTPTIKIYKEDWTLVVSDNMTELNDWFYIYNFTDYNEWTTYAVIADWWNDNLDSRYQVDWWTLYWWLNEEYTKTLLETRDYAKLAWWKVLIW